MALIEKLKGVPKEKRKIVFKVAIAISNGEKIVCEIGEIEGFVANSPKGNNGFGFDEIFELASSKTLAEIPTEEKLKVSPRRKALEKLKNYLKK